jgi:hypothetical protein
MAGPCKQGNESSGYIKGGIVFDYISYYQLFKEDSTLFSYLYTLKLIEGLGLRTCNSFLQTCIQENKR